MSWKVFEEEKRNRNWLDMPKEYLGTPLYEHATDYITELSNGEKVMVSKKTGKVFENYTSDGLRPPHLADDKQIAKMRSIAKKNKKGYRRTGIYRVLPNGI